MKNLRLISAVFGLMLAFAAASLAQGTVLTSINGEKVNIQGQNGKVVILAVGASWLPLSKEQANVTNKLARRFAGRDVVVYFVFTDSANQKSRNFASDEDLRAFAAKNKVDVTLLRDSDGALTLKKFGIDQLPSFVVIDKNGNQAGEVFGGIDPAKDISVPIAQSVDRILIGL